MEDEWDEERRAANGIDTSSTWKRGKNNEIY